MITRRTLLAMAPAVLTASKSDSKNPIVGSGAYQYEMISDWGELPAGLKYGNTHGVCEDSQGHIYIHHTVNKTSEKHDTMVVFDAKGKFVKSWGAAFEGGAHGLHIHKEGREEFLYLCDTKRALVVKTTLAGEEVFTLKYPQESKEYGAAKIKYSPTNLAIAPNGDIYVGDGYGSSYINQYNSKGEYIRTFGGKGKEAGSAGLSARNHCRPARQGAAAVGGGSRQCAAAIFHDGRETREICRRDESAVSFQRAQRRVRDP